MDLGKRLLIGYTAYDNLGFVHQRPSGAVAISTRVAYASHKAQVVHGSMLYAAGDDKHMGVSDQPWSFSSVLPVCVLS